MSCAVQQYQGAEKAYRLIPKPAAPIRSMSKFIGFAGVRGIAELRGITRGHVIGWRKDLEKRARSLQHPPQALGPV